MAESIPPGSNTDNEAAPPIAVPETQEKENLADLKIFWGPEICRLEYLIHLVETGRIKDGSLSPSL